MIKKYSLILIAFLCFVLSGYGQIAENSFESTGDTWLVDSFSTPPCNDGSGDQWDYDNSLSSITPSDGSQFWGIQDLDGNCGGSGFETITFTTQNISSYTSVTISFDYYIIGFDNGDDLGYEVWEDGTRVANVDNWAGSTGGWITLTHNVNAATTNVYLVLKARQNGNGDYAGFDNVILDGTPSTPTPNITATPTTINNLDYTFGNGPSAPQSFDVTGTLLAAGTTVTSNSTDFEVSLTAVGGYNSFVTVPAGSLNGTTTIYTRLVAGLAVNTYSNTISISNPTPGLGTTPTITVNGEVIPPPPTNDDCSGAISLTPTSTCSYTTYSNLNSTDSGEGNPGCANYNGEDVWFSVVVPSTGEITIDTDNIDFTDSGMALYSGTCGSLTLIECDDDGSSNGNMSLISRTGLTPSSTVYIRVWEFNGGTTGDFGICVTTPTPCVAPTNQPTGLTLNNITGSSIDGSFTATTADDYLVVVSTSPTLGANPVNGTTYTNGDSLGSGTVVQSSNATTFTATGLSQTTQYYFFVFALNDSSCAGGPAYNTTTPLNGTATTVTGPCASESFNNAGNDNSYGPINWTGDNSVNWTATDSRSDEDLAGDEAIMLRSNGNGILSNDNPIPGGCGVITFDYARIYSGNSVFQVWINGVQYGGDIAVSSTASSTFSATVNVPGNISLEIRNVSSTNDRRFLVSNLSWTCYSGTPNPELQLVDETTTNQNCGFTLDLGSTGTNVGILDLTFDIENTGTVDLDISSLAIAGTNSGDFSIVSPIGAFTVTPGNAQTVTVQFAPTANGTRTATLTINNNDVDEGSCIVNLTGDGVNPVPEIRVETNAGNNIPDGAGIAVVYNNNFGNETEGATSASKTYIIENLGTGNLVISSITVSTTEFTITGNPAPITLAPGDSAPLLIAFSPSTPGVKNATVTINNNDSDEDPFTFAVRGTGVCGSSTMTSSPDSGPEGTIVTFTDLSNNISAATVSLNGTPLSVNVVNNNVIEVTIPSGAQTGNLLITNSFGCESLFPFSVINNQIGGCEGGTSLSEIFISEVTDATYGGLSYVELFNATGAPVNLSNYTLELYQNGNTDPTNTNRYKTATLSGTIGVNQTFLIAIGNDIYDCPQAGADGSFADLEITGFGGLNKPDNEHDYLALLNSGTLIDEFGVFGDNDWMDSVHTTISGEKGFNFRRLNTATPLPNPLFDDNQWNIIDWAGSGSGSCSSNDYTDIGTFDFSTSLPPTVTLQPVSPTFACVFSATLSIAGDEGFDGGTDTQDLAYQWYFNAPGDATWTEILSGNSNYTGQQSATLNIVDTFNLDGYQYYCQLREDSATCFEASEAVRLSVLKSVWDGVTSTWSAPPTIGRYAVINGNYDTSVDANQSSFSACGLLVNAPFGLDIRDGDHILIENDIIANGDITVFPQGSVVQINDLASVSGSGTMTVQKLTSILNTPFDYTYWSSPVSGETVENVFSTVPAGRRFVFNANNFNDTLIEINNTGTFTSGQDDIDDDGNDWQAASGTMVAGIGYAATPSTVGPAFPVAQQFPFVGPFNNGVISPTIVNNSGGAYNDWNFVGNPYPSAISTATFFAVNSGITDAIYLWSQATPADANASGNEGYNFSGADYAVISASGVNTAGGDTSLIPDDYVPSGQGFFIEAQSGGTITFNNSMRVTGNNSQFFRNENSGTRNVLWLNLSSDNGVANQLAVAHLEGATDENDGSYYDVQRNISTQKFAKIYSIIEGSDTEYVIQGKSLNSLDLDEVIQIGFNTAITSPTLFTISIAQFEGDFYSENDIYLKDNLLNSIQNLKNSDYNFTSETGVFNDRFEIVFTADALSIDDNLVNTNNLTVTELPNGEIQIKVGAKHSITNVTILDALGREIYNLSGSNSIEVYNLSKLSQAAYIAKVTLSNGQVISKKAIKQR